VDVVIKNYKIWNYTYTENTAGADGDGLKPSQYFGKYKYLRFALPN